VKIKIIEMRTGCQHGEYFYYNENGPHKTFDWAGGPHAAGGLDIADLVIACAA